MPCADALQFNPLTNRCDFPLNVRCTYGGSPAFTLSPSGRNYSLIHKFKLYTSQYYSTAHISWSGTCELEYYIDTILSVISLCAKIVKPELTLSILYVFKSNLVLAKISYQLSKV